MYFMLSGTELFPDKSMTETIMSQMNQEPEPLGKRMASRGLTVPADLEAVVTRCLNKEPDERYQNARELEAALRACADHQPDLRTSSGIEAKADVRKVAGDS
jgi:serine/threonine protein kinase